MKKLICGMLTVVFTFMMLEGVLITSKDIDKMNDYNVTVEKGNVCFMMFDKGVIVGNGLTVFDNENNIELI